jgi:outer membrane receptor for ferrienterochelin and colicins
MYRIIIFIFVLTTKSVSIYAKQYNATIKGLVQVGGTPQVGVTVFVSKLNRGTSTGTDGKFTINNVPDGLYQVRFSLIGYKSLIEEVKVENGNAKELLVTLNEDNLNLEQVVVSGTRNEISFYKSPVVVSTLNNRLFESTQSLSISEGLSFSPGLRLENNCQNCGFTQLRMNGLDGPYSQILINSRPIFSALAGVYGLDMLPANMVDRIEVVRGGGSALYGGNAIAGTVNIITKDPVKNAFEVGYNHAFTNLLAPDKTITYNASLVNDDLSKGISFYGYNRQRAPWDANDDGLSEITLLQNNTFGMDAFWNTSKFSKLKFGGYFINEFRRGGGDFDLIPHQSSITEQLDHKIAGGNFSFELYDKSYKHKVSIYSSIQYVQRASYYGAGGRIIMPGDTLTTQDILAINAYGNSNDLSLVSGLQYAWEVNKKIMLTTGSEWQYNNVVDKMPGYNRSITQQVSTLGNYAQLEWRPTNRVTILSGGRFDFVSIDGSYRLEDEEFINRKEIPAFVPRISGMYDLTSNLKARLSFAQGFRAPQAYDEDLHIETVGGAARFIRLDQDLQTERSNSYTASLSYSKTKGKRQVSLLAETFYTELINAFILSDQVELPNGIAVITKRNGNGAIVRGLNLEANYALSRNLIFQSGITVQQAFYKEEEEIWSPSDTLDTTEPTSTISILRTPNLYGFFSISWKPKTRWDVSYSGVYTGSMLVAHVVDPKTERSIIKQTRDFFENNIKVAYNIATSDGYKMQLFAGVQNIFNAFQQDFDRGVDRDAGYVYGPARPRTLFFGLKFGLK